MDMGCLESPRKDMQQLKLYFLNNLRFRGVSYITWENNDKIVEHTEVGHYTTVETVVDCEDSD